MRKVKEGGFTLIELMITVAIVGILAAVAYPSYMNYVKKGLRRAAQAQMLDIANRERIEQVSHANTLALHIALSDNLVLPRTPHRIGRQRPMEPGSRP